MHPKKRILLDIKSNLSQVSHDFGYEYFYLKTYLGDGIALLQQANYLSPDVQLYSIESDKYFWSEYHTFYFTSSFITMLMQISENLVNQCCDEWKEFLGNNLMIKNCIDPFYEKFRKSLFKKIELDLNSSKWRELSDLYQVRNALVHRNGKLKPGEKPERITAIQNLRNKYKSIEVIDGQVIIDEQFRSLYYHLFYKLQG